MGRMVFRENSGVSSFFLCEKEHKKWIYCKRKIIVNAP